MPESRRAPRSAALTQIRRYGLGDEAAPTVECIALLLQGGGALDVYQAGVYETLAEADLHPDRFRSHQRQPHAL